MKNRNIKKKNNNRRGQGLTKFAKMIEGDHTVYTHGQTKTVCKIPGLFVEKAKQLRLVFSDNTTVRTVGAASALNWTLRGSAFDPDPSFGTGAVPGFTEWTGFFNNYRVLGIGVSGWIANPENTAVVFAVVPYGGGIISNNSLPKNTIMDYEANRMAKGYTLAALGSGANVIKIKHFWDYSRILGSDNYLLDDNFASQVGTNPASLCYVLHMAARLDGGNFVTGVETNLQFHMDVEFSTPNLKTT